MRVLLVEDDPMIGDALRVALHDASCAVHWVRDAAGAEESLFESEPQVIVLDLGLPDLDGIELVKRIRASQCVSSIVVITAREALEARVRALDSGADDYIVKPFAVEELLARMRAVVRRQAGQPLPVLTNGIISLEPASRLATRGELAMVLGSREFALLHALLLRPGAILSRAQIEDRVYGPGEEVQSNAVEFLIHGIRKKFGPDTIRNVRGAGWMVERPR